MRPKGWWVTGLLQGFVVTTMVFSASLAPAGEPASLAPQGQSRTMLPDGRWLLLGGVTEAGASAGGVIADPRTGSSEPLPQPMARPRAGHTATVLPDGTVLIFGGEDGAGRLVEPAELFDPGTLGITSFHAFDAEPRAWHTATLLTDGSIAIVGGVGPGGTPATTIERWSAFTQLLHPDDLALQSARVAATAELLADGTVLLRGGVDGAGRPVEIDETVDFDQGLVSQMPRASAGVPRGTAGASTVVTRPGNGASEVPVDTVLVGRFSRMVDVRIVDGAQRGAGRRPGRRHRGSYRRRPGRPPGLRHAGGLSQPRNAVLLQHRRPDGRGRAPCGADDGGVPDGRHSGPGRRASGRSARPRRSRARVAWTYPGCAGAPRGGARDTRRSG